MFRLMWSYTKVKLLGVDDIVDMFRVDNFVRMGVIFVVVGNCGGLAFDVGEVLMKIR